MTKTPRVTQSTNGNLTLEFLDRCEDITREFEKKGGWSHGSQILHIYEEVSEVQRALRNQNMRSMKLELCDIILSSITMFHKIGVKPKDIQKFMEETLQKVEQRSGVY